MVTDQEIEEKAPLFSSLPLAKQKAISFFNYVYPDMICKNWLKLKYDDQDQDFQDSSDLTHTAHAALELTNGQDNLASSHVHDEANEPFEDNEMQLQTIEAPTSVDQLQPHDSNTIDRDDDIVLSDTEFDVLEDEKQPVSLPATSSGNTCTSINIDSTSTTENVCNTEKTSSAGRANSKRKSDEFSDGDLQEETVLTASAESSKSDDSAANTENDIQLQPTCTDATSNKNKRQRQDKDQASANLDSSSSTASTSITTSQSVATTSSTEVPGQKHNTVKGRSTITTQPLKPSTARLMQKLVQQRNKNVSEQ
jgi:hypothetical protein